VMRVSFYFFLAIIAFSFGSYAHAQASTQSIFTQNLSLGSQNTKVRELQKILNQNLDTQVTNSGPGSPGNETNYFGPLTKAAVIRFQEKYANDILTPAGMLRGNGFVGTYTRAKLSALSAPGISTVVVPPITPSAPIVVPSSNPPAPTTTPQNPNLKNVDLFFAALDKVAAKQGISAAEIAILKKQALLRLATTTDLRAAFLKTMQATSLQTTADNSLGGKILATIEQAFNKVFMPEHALAATGAPFGGALIFAMPCDGGVWNITLKPPLPSFPVLLAYESGSQAFLSHNIPFTTWLLGEYEPVPMAYCWVGIYPYPSEGIITPVVGSSPL
ncbi:MAG TPA: peptidoglycan-binding protein, partial [Candidatus Paceibacterota bacterium]|nr:peptidoglycan-binding protein [Candidatus Paceibacterota bacterium]